MLADGVTISCPALADVRKEQCTVHEVACDRTVDTTVMVGNEPVNLIWTSNTYPSDTVVSSLSEATMNHSFDLICTYEGPHGATIKFKTNSVTGYHTCQKKNEGYVHEFIDCDEADLRK